jgi:hypothetical protein
MPTPSVGWFSTHTAAVKLLQKEITEWSDALSTEHGIYIPIIT